MNSTIKRLLSCTAMCLVSSEAVAQTVDSTIILKLSGAPNTGDYSIGDEHYLQLSYDASFISGSGDEMIMEGSGLLELEFDFNGVIYDETFDQTNNFPQVYFSDSQLVGIDFWNNQGLKGGGDSSFFRFFKDQTFNYSPMGESEYAGEYRVVSIPEPNIPSYVCLSSAVLLLRRKRL